MRFSPIFKLRGDSVQVYVYAQKYDNATSGNSDRLRFERAYQVVPNGERLARRARRSRSERDSRRAKVSVTLGMLADAPRLSPTRRRTYRP